MPTYKIELIITAFDADLGPDVRSHVAFDDQLLGLEEDAHGKKETLTAEIAITSDSSVLRANILG